MRKLTLIMMIGLAPFLSSCNESDEMDDLNKAQTCLDKVPQSAPDQATACLQYVEKYNSQQAKILKCSIHLTSGGLTEDKVVQAAEVLESSTAENKEAQFMTILALNHPNITDAYTKALLADPFCQESGVPGLKWIAGLVVAGTYLNKMMFDANAGGAGFPYDPNDLPGSIEDYVQYCAAGGQPSGCFTEPEVLGNIVTTLADSYCEFEESNDMCKTFDETLAAAGDDPARVGVAAFCYMEVSPPRKYDPATNACVPL